MKTRPADMLDFSTDPPSVKYGLMTFFEGKWHRLARCIEGCGHKLELYATKEERDARRSEVRKMTSR